MKNVTYISAGAGSGKTHTLTKTLSELLEDSRAGFPKTTPERVILTTFTVKAASEFKERAKAFLYEKGLNDEASRMDQAMMGTIHSIANSFIGKYWFHLGLSPNMNVLLEEDVDFYVSQSLAELPTEEELGKLRAFRDAFDKLTPWSPDAYQAPDYDYWKNELNSIIGFATNYGIEDFDGSREKSMAFFRQFVRPGVKVHTDSAYLLNLLDAEARLVETHRESATKDERIRKIKLLKRTAGKADLQWLKTFASIPTATDAKNDPAIEEFLDDFSHIWQSEYVYTLVEEHISLIFDLATRWRENYAAYKRRKRLIDYNDMEKYMYELLQMPEVTSEISRSFDYLFVDEFQDCSPIQVKIFDKLSELVSHSWWVGDFKQAIYGFRGSDTELTKAVVDRVECQADGCSSETLDTSYRSLPDIVDLTNKAFTTTFASVLSKEKVVLKANRKAPEGFVSLKAYQTDNLPEVLPSFIQDLISRGVRLRDIAVLARTNPELDQVQSNLSGKGIPCSRPTTSVADSNVWILIRALLSIVLNDGNDLAKATVAFLTQQGRGTANLIEEKLAFDVLGDKEGRSYLDDVPMLSKLLSIRPALRQQSVGALVESMAIELGLFDLMRGWGNYKGPLSVLHTVTDTAKQYEEHSIQMNLPATINGFMDYVNLVNPACPGDETGIQLFTCHGAKGLEWKHVFLMSLDYNPVDEKKLLKREIFGVHAVHESRPTSDDFYPTVSIIVRPWLYGDRPRQYAPEDIRRKVTETDEFSVRRDAVLAEANRLFYVAVTRASDVLTLMVKPGDGAFTWPVSIGLTHAGANPPAENGWDCLGTGHRFVVLDSDQDLESQEDLKSGVGGDDLFRDYRLAVPFAGKPCTAPPKYRQPSNTEGTAAAALLLDTGRRIPLGKMGCFKMADIGTCIHNIYCTLDGSAPCDIEGYIAMCGMSEVLPDPQSIKDAWDTLTVFLEDKYGPSVARKHELPFTYCEGGQVFTGSMDLVWQTAEGSVLVDFKTCPKGKDAILNPEDYHYAGHYGGQFGCYTRVLEAHGDKVLERIVYYPVSGLVISLD